MTNSERRTSETSANLATLLEEAVALKKAKEAADAENNEVVGDALFNALCDRLTAIAERPAKSISDVVIKAKAARFARECDPDCGEAFEWSTASLGMSVADDVAALHESGAL